MSDSDRHSEPSRALARASQPLAEPLVHPHVADRLAAGAEVQGNQPRRLSVSVFLRYKWTVLLVAVVVAAMGQAYVWTCLAPEYRATAVIEVQPIIDRVLNETEEKIPYYSAYLESQADFAVSEPVLNRVLGEQAIKETRWYKAEPVTLLDKLRSPAEPLVRLRNALDVEVPRKKQLLQVSVTTPFPGEAKLIADTVVTHYLSFIEGTRYEEDNELLENLKEKQQDVRDEIQAKESDLRILQDRPDLRSPDLDALLAERKKELEAMEAEVEELKLERAIVERRLTALEADNASADSQPTAKEFAHDPEWRRISNELEDVQLELAAAERRLGDLHPEVINLRDRLESLTRRLEAHESALTARALRPTLEHEVGPQEQLYLPNNPAVLRQRLEDLETRLEMTESDMLDKQAAFSQTWDRYRECNDLENDLAAARADFGRFERRISELEQRKLAPAHIRPVGKAVEPRDPTEDRRPKLALAALVGAFGAGLSAAAVRFWLSPKVQDVRDVDAYPTVGSFLGFLPLHDKSDPETAHSLLPMRQERVRAIRTALLARLASFEQPVVQITSAGPGAGKTTFALLLARSLARSGKRVLLIDADLRRPALTRRMTSKRLVGLSDLLRNPDRHGGVRSTKTPNLDVVLAGRNLKPRAVEALANGAFHGLLDQWRSNYDLILIDGGPLLPVADGVMLAQHADASIVLVREGHCDRSLVAEAMAQLNSVGCHPLGLVFVGSPRRSQGYGASYYYAYAEGESGSGRGD